MGLPQPQIRKKNEITTSTDDSDQVEEKAKISSKERKRLFDLYEEADKDLREAKEAFDAADVERSMIVKEIAEKCGKGPWQWNDMIVSIAVKNGRYFFRTKKQSDIEKI